MNEGNTFDEISIEQPAGEANVISKTVADKAATLLTTAEGRESRLRFGFIDSETEARTEWTLINPEAAQTADQTVTATLTIGADNTVTTSVGEQALQAERIEIAFGKSVEKDADTVNKLKGIFGEEGYDLMLQDIAEGRFDVDDYYGWVRIYDISGMTPGQNYAVEKYIYRGDIDEENNSIYISSFPNDKFAEGELESIVQYYVDNNRKFNMIHIEEKISENNIIKKDYINLARQILSTEEDVEKLLIFVFCGCSEIDGEFIQNDMNWNFVNPGEAEQDINANAVLATSKNQGVTVRLKANTYNADEVALHFLANRNTEKAQSMIAALGEAAPQDSDEAGMLILKDSEAYEDSYADWKEENEGRWVSLYVGMIQDWTPEEDYQLVKLEYLKEIITGEYPMPVPEGAASCVWKSYTTDVAEVSDTGILKPIGEGEAYLSVSYSLNGENYLKAYHAWVGVGLEAIAFDKTQLTMELPEEGADWEAREYLSVRYYPSNATMDMNPALLTWTTSDDKVVELVYRDFDGKCEGEIKAVGAGKAVVKATYNDKIYAECEITVEKPFAVPDEEWGDVYAITNLYTTLADVELPSKNWAWKDRTTKLAPFIGMEWTRFPAVYTAEDGRKREFILEVRMVTITGLDIGTITRLENNEYVWNPDIPEALADGEEIVMNYELLFENGWQGDVAKYFGKNGRLQTVWTSQPNNAGTASVGDAYPEGSYKFQASSANAGKKTFTVSVVDTTTNKVIAKNSVSLTVTKKATMDFAKMAVEGLDKIEKGQPQESGNLIFTVPVTGYYPLTVQSTDSSILTLGRASVKEETLNDGTKVYKTEVPYTIKNSGTVQLAVTAKDEIKSKWTYDVAILDKEPKVLETSFAINKVYSDKKAPLTIAYTDSYGSAGEDSVVVTGENAQKFEYVTTGYADGKTEGYLVLKDKNLRNGNYTVDLKIKVQNVKDTADTAEFETKVKVKVVDKKPSITYKQTKKVNTFYKATGENHAGLLTVNAGKAEIVSVETKENASFVIAKAGDGENVYTIKVAEGVQNIDSRVTLICTIKDETYGTYTEEKVLSVSKEEKAPKLTLSAKGDTLYPVWDYKESTLYITNAGTGELVDISAVSWVADKNKPGTDFTKESIPAELKKNTFTLSLEKDHGIHFVLDTKTAGTDKITLRIREEDWAKEIDVAYSLKVDTKEPKLKLSSTKLSLNKNINISDGQLAETLLSFSGYVSGFKGSVYFSGDDEKSKAILNDKLALEYWGDGRIVARLNTTKQTNNDLETGTYKYKVTAKDGSFNKTISLTVNIFDEAPEKCIKVSSKGSIDALRRGTTYVAYTPKIKNLSGTVVDGYLTGQDADLFYWEFDQESGQLRVKACEGVLLSTKLAYKVKPVFILRTATGAEYEVTAGEQSVKIKQGKPKAVITPVAGNVLYRQAGNNLKLSVAAVLQNEGVVVSDVRLLNYNSDLSLSYDRETQTLSVSQTRMKAITKTGKTWNLKFAVSYKDKAGNEKDAVVTYKIIIK